MRQNEATRKQVVVLQHSSPKDQSRISYTRYEGHSPLHGKAAWGEGQRKAEKLFLQALRIPCRRDTNALGGCGGGEPVSDRGFRLRTTVLAGSDIVFPGAKRHQHQVACPAWRHPRFGPKTDASSAGNSSLLVFRPKKVGGAPTNVTTCEVILDCRVRESKKERKPQKPATKYFSCVKPACSRPSFAPQTKHSPNICKRNYLPSKLRPKK